jgi:hypothetical protein
MVNYNNGKVYKIQPIVEHEEGEIYIGSTTKKYLSQRMDSHRRSFKSWKEGKQKKCMSFDLFEKYGIENCQILLIENVYANSKDELISREGYYIRNMKCINRCIPGRLKQEYDKTYRENNQAMLKDKKHKYYVDNKDKAKLYSLEYRKNNKDKLKLYTTEYYKNNKEIIIEKRLKKVFCNCGGHYTVGQKARHFKSFKHQSRMELFDRVNHIIKNFQNHYYHLHQI